MYDCMRAYSHLGAHTLIHIYCRVSLDWGAQGESFFVTSSVEPSVSSALSMLPDTCMPKTRKGVPRRMTMLAMWSSSVTVL